MQGMHAFVSDEIRYPTEAEANLIRDMLVKAGFPEKIKAVDSLLACPMNDGGMGSLYLFSKGNGCPPYLSRKMGDQIWQVEKRDADGTPVSISLNLDLDGELYELDVFKADFSPIGVQGIAGLVDIESIGPKNETQALSEMRLALAYTVLLEASKAWSADDLPFTVLLGRMGRGFFETIPLMRDTQIRVILNTVEHLLVEGNQNVKDGIATGFLEALQHQADSGRGSFARINPFFGKESRAYCHAWDKFTGAKTPGLD